MKRMILSALLLALAAIPARAEVVGELKGLIIEAATSAELEETVFPAFYLITRADAPNDMRVSDGVTPGGLRVCPEGVLTNIPNSFPHAVAMNGNTINLNGSYSIGAEGPHCYIRSNGSNVLSILAQTAGIGETISTEYAGDETLRVTISVDDSATDPLVEYSPSITDPVWTDCVYSVTRPTTNLMQIDITIPDEDDAGYFRITALTGFRARFGIPLEAPSVETASLTLSGVARTNWPDGGGSTFTNVGFGLTGDGDETALAVDTSIVATGTPLYAESDPVWTDYLANELTNTIDSRIATEGVTGAVTKIVVGTNDLDGAITFSGATNEGNTVYFSGGEEVDPKVLASLEGYEADYYVAKWGDDSNSGTDWTNAFLTIQAAVYASSTNTAKIFVYDGIYGRVLFTNETFKIYAVNSRQVIIDGNFTNTRLFSGDTAPGSASRAINGIVLRNSFNKTDVGTPYLYPIRGINLHDCLVIDCTNKRGVIYQPKVVENSRIERCAFGANGAIINGYMVGGSSAVKNTVFYRNIDYDGGNDGFLTVYANIYNCEFYDNNIYYAAFRGYIAAGNRFYNNENLGVILPTDYFYGASGVATNNVVFNKGGYSAGRGVMLNGDTTVKGDITLTTGNYYYFPSGSYFDDDGTNLFYVNATGLVSQVTTNL